MGMYQKACELKITMDGKVTTRYENVSEKFDKFKSLFRNS